MFFIKILSFYKLKKLTFQVYLINKEIFINFLLFFYFNFDHVNTFITFLFKNIFYIKIKQKRNSKRSYLWLSNISKTVPRRVTITFFRLEIIYTLLLCLCFIKILVKE